MKRRLVLNGLAGLILAGALCTVPVFAQEAEGKKSEAANEKEGGMEIWKVANFVILVGILGFLIRKNGAPLLAARSRSIEEALAAGERANAEAKAKAAQVDARLAGLDTEIAALRDQARADRDHETARIRRDTQNELARIRQQAADEIESASKQARLEVRRHAAKLALDLAEKKVRDRMSEGAQAGLVDSFVADMAGVMAEKEAR
jgi:F-type H+-transporting ATPase subunit b